MVSVRRIENFFSVLQEGYVRLAGDEMTGATRKRRSDSQRTRDKLLDSMGTMLRSHGLAFTLPDLAREAGVATATVYRHFDDVHEVRSVFYERILDSLRTAFHGLSDQYTGLDLFRRICAAWVGTAEPWARAATFIRSAEGYLERVQAGDPMTGGLHTALRPVIDQLVEAGDLPDQDRDFAVLTWITLFDERVIVDLRSAFGWSADEIAEQLAATTLRALGWREPA